MYNYFNLFSDLIKNPSAHKNYRRIQEWYQEQGKQEFADVFEYVLSMRENDNDTNNNQEQRENN